MFIIFPEVLRHKTIINTHVFIVIFVNKHKYTKGYYWLDYLQAHFRPLFWAL